MMFDIFILDTIESPLLKINEIIRLILLKLPKIKIK